MTDERTPTGTLKRPQTRRAALAAIMGGALEYYDFALFGAAAALIFPTVFFQNSDVAYLASFLTFGAAYIARPLGAVVLSHIGDRFGRKLALLLTISIMGVATFLIGCLPTYEMVGVLAPIILVALRLAQGFSAGAELAGASTLTLEHAPSGKRGFISSFSLVGVGIGMLLANLVMIPIAALPDEQLFAWGWRIPFLLSIVVLAIGIWIRRGVEEPEVFVEQVEKNAKKSVPILEAFRFNWQGIVRVALANLFPVVQTVVTVFALAYAVQEGVDRTAMVIVAAVGQVVCIAVRPIAGALSDRLGRKPVFITGVVGSGLLIFPYFAAIAADNLTLVFVINVLLTGVFIGAADGAYPSFYSEMFSARVRYTGMAVGLQIGILMSGFSPTIGTALQGADHANWLPVALMTVTCSAIAVLTALTAKETSKTPLKLLGRTRQVRRVEERDARASRAAEVSTDA